MTSAADDPPSVTPHTLSLHAIQRLYVDDLEAHWQAATARGLSCPLEVFAKLFHVPYHEPDLERMLQDVDWRTVRWERRTLTGEELRQVAIDRAFEHALDEAYDDVMEEGFIHERPDVAASWEEQGTWIEPPLLVSGDVLGSPVQYMLVIGHTRLGCARAFLDLGRVSESSLHEVWVGSPVPT